MNKEVRLNASIKDKCFVSQSLLSSNHTYKLDTIFKSIS